MRSSLLAAAAALVSASAAVVVPAAQAGPVTGRAVQSAAAATPAVGGTLNVLGSGDTDYLDPNITYYSLGYSAVREVSRQLYSYAAVGGATTTTTPDLATAMPKISSDGRTYRVTIRKGAKWNTSPARQVTAADFARGVKTTCNPWQPFGGSPDFDFLISGLRSFCRGFAGVSGTAAAMRRYTEHHSISGIHAAAGHPRTVVIHLTQRASFFTDMLTLPAFSPRAKEMLGYIPGSVAAGKHLVSDGPYVVNTYAPTKKIVYTRNPAWNGGTDPIRAAYVDKIVIDETWDPETGQQQLEAGDPSADVAFGGVPSNDVPGLEAANDPNLSVKSEIASNPYLLFNTRSPNNSGALKKTKVRRALSFALNRSHLIGDLGGPKLAPPLTHVLPRQIVGSRSFNLYPHNTAKAKSMLAAAGAKNLTLKFLYRPSSPSSTALFHTVKHDLANAGITVKAKGVADADFYTKYLQRPSQARHGVWDLTLAGWGPDWYGNAALSFFGPLFDGRVDPPTSSNFGLFNDPAVNKLIDQAAAAGPAAAADLWHKADHRVMADAAFFPVTNPNQGSYHASQVHGFVYLPAFQTGDFTNMWLDPAKNGS